MITPALRSCWNVLRSVHACLTFLLECFAFEHACCLPHSAKQNGLREVTFLFRRGSGSPVVRSQIDGAVIGFRGFTSGLCVSLWRSRRRTKGTRRTESAASQSAFCVNISALRRFPRGVRWGLRAPKPAPKSHWLSGLSSFGSRCGCVLRSEGDSRTTRACLAPISGGRAKWKRARPAARQQPPVQRRMCFFVTTVSGRKSRDFIYSVRL